MKNLGRILMICGALVLLLIFLFPIWSITLVAPQYPEGITMYIWLNQITGDTPSTLQNINILNHYVGMKYIEPDSIPELTYFPYIIYAFTGLGLLFGIIGNRKLYLVWVILLLLTSILGIYDFYLWEYDYGHNLSDTAPIKIEGMVYQPPLIGEKYLLNFLAKSYPHTGAIFYALGFVFSFFAFYFTRKKK